MHHAGARRRAPIQIEAEGERLLLATTRVVPQGLWSNLVSARPDTSKVSEQVSIAAIIVQTPIRWPASGNRPCSTVAETVAEAYRAIRIERYPLSTMMRAVLDLRAHYTVYDAAYVVLAQALAAPLISADAKLLEARKVGVDVQVMQPSP